VLGLVHILLTFLCQIVVCDRTCQGGIWRCVFFVDRHAVVAYGVGLSYIGIDLWLNGDLSTIKPLIDAVTAGLDDLQHALNEVPRFKLLP